MVALLYNRSCNTLLSSSLRIRQLVDFCVENGYETVGLIDKNVLFGAMEFHHLCKQNNLKPIYGLEVSVLIDSQNYPYVLVANNNIGYQKLIKISSKLNDDLNFLTLEQLSALEDITVIEVSKRGYLEHVINTGDINELLKYAETFKRFKRFYIGLQSPRNNNYYRQLNEKIEEFASKYELNTVALPLALYEKESDFEAYKVLQAINQSRSVNDAKLVYETDSHLLKQNEMLELFSSVAINNTEVIVNSCNTDLDKLPKASLPEFPTPDGIDSKLYLNSLCQAGLKKRFNNQRYPESYAERLRYELNVIFKMGFEDYFLIVWDFILYARKNNIYVGVGRGSAAGSLVAYCLGITHIDPLKYGLLFERFLNPERISMPDIDVDFPDDKREQVIQYVIDKYGADHISHIITFNTLAARQVLKDAGKASDIPASNIDLITKLVENVPKMTLMKSYQTNKRFNTAINSSDSYRKLFNIALKLEGLPRHTSTHAAGIVMSDMPLETNMPVIKLDDNSYSTQYTMEYLEEMGLIKMDFLGLKNLSVIAEIVENVNKKQELDILKIPLNDEKTFKLICEANTAGIFQLDSDGMKNLIRKMQPRTFEDIAVTIALFRPGPMENIPEYLQARSNPNNIHYIHPDLKPILKETYGIMIYQEQIMQVAQKIAGFSLSKADLLRKAISKKIPEQINSLESEFKNGALANGYSQNVAESVFNDIKKFANYGFNKSHSVAYGLLAYQLAYLKANYPLEFYLSLLNSVIGGETKTNEYIVEARRSGIKVLSPDINRSDISYRINDGCLRFPLNTIKGIGRIAAGNIITERKRNGIYQDYYDFVVRSSTLKTNKNVYESLIKSGCLDCFRLTRSTMLNGLEETLRYAELVKVDVNGQIQIDLQLVDKPILKFYPDNALQNSRYEEEMIGFYLNGHPVEKYRGKYQDVTNSINLKKVRGNVRTIFQIQRIKEYRTKTGEMMCFVDGYDEYGEINTVFMPNTYNRFLNSIKKSNIVLVEGTIDDRLSVKVNNMSVLEGQVR